MKLVSLSMVKNEEYWIWYSLTSVYPWVDEILVFDNFSTDRTAEIVRGMTHIADKLTLIEQFGSASEQDTREAMLEFARSRGATHIVHLDGDEVHNDSNLGFCRQLLELHEHRPALRDPPVNPRIPGDPNPTDGILVKHIGFRPVHPGYAGIDTCRPQDLTEPDTFHGCYNFAIRISSLANLHGNGLEWGLHGFAETDDICMQSSPCTLWLPKLYYHHFSWHPRSSRRIGHAHYGRASQDLGSVPAPSHVRPPEVLFRPDGPGNPTLSAWGIEVGRELVPA
ncbi:MAG: glycosyltransferase family 2 protein [Planctomycetes bacterium]|nr:glycosyltransferase family 2 protein [Planctomycetota bacterium]MCB9871565.1 glycosyltransferase family 2 protein [Planctomycetota bacterium]